jgi:hypothetical protein
MQHADMKIAVDLVNGESVIMPSIPDYSSDGHWGLSLGKDWPELPQSRAIRAEGHHAYNGHNSAARQA